MYPVHLAGTVRRSSSVCDERSLFIHVHGWIEKLSGDWMDFGWPKMHIYIQYSTCARLYGGVNFSDLAI